MAILEKSCSNLGLILAYSNLIPSRICKLSPYKYFIFRVRGNELSINVLAFLLFSTSIGNYTWGRQYRITWDFKSLWVCFATLPFISGNAVGIIIVIGGFQCRFGVYLLLYPEPCQHFGNTRVRLICCSWRGRQNMQIRSYKAPPTNRSGFASGVLVQVSRTLKVGLLH